MRLNHSNIIETINIELINNHRGSLNMDKDERYIEEHLGRENPFRVPDHYFEDFAKQLEMQLPEQPKEATASVVALHPRKPWWHRPALLWSAGSVSAACLALFFLHLGNGKMTPQPATASSQHVQTSTWSGFDQMADYTMTDTNDMYAYMADAQ